MCGSETLLTVSHGKFSVHLCTKHRLYHIRISECFHFIIAENLEALCYVTEATYQEQGEISSAVG